MTAKKPTLRPGQVAVKLNIAVPSHIFDLPTITANLAVSSEVAVLPELTVEMEKAPDGEG